MSSNRNVSIGKVLAMICKKHQIRGEQLDAFIEAEGELNIYEEMMVERKNKQLVEQDIILENVDTLDINFDQPIDDTSSEPDDVTEEKDDLKYSDDKDDIKTDPNYEPSPLKRPKFVFKSDIPREMWEEAYRYWTRQDTKELADKPLVISTEYINKLRNKRSVKDVLQRFRFVGNHDHIKRLRDWVKQEEEDRLGTVRDVNKIVREWFIQRRACHQPVNDRLLRKWGLKAKMMINPRMRFSASASWVLNFKRENCIVSRSITHKVGKDFWKKMANTEAKVATFHQLFEERLEDGGYFTEEIVNIDQSRFDKELHSHRTLNQKGEKQVFLEVGSKSATDHSFCIMPMLFMNGTLAPSLYLLSSESKHHFPQVHTPIFPPNVKAFACTSAMMCKKDLVDYLRYVFWPSLRELCLKKCLLLADSWSSNKDDTLFKEIQEENSDIIVERILIPEGTTGIIQPADVFYFRPLKQFVRHISDFLEMAGFKIWQRDNFMKLQSFAHYQFGAPRFRDIIGMLFLKQVIRQLGPSYSKHRYNIVLTWIVSKIARFKIVKKSLITVVLIAKSCIASSIVLVMYFISTALIRLINFV